MDQPHSIFPVIACSDLDAARDFYRDLLGLEVAFESGWYTLLRSRTDSDVQVGFVQSGHQTVPRELGTAASGVLVSVIVPDVDTVHARAVEMHANIVLSLRDEEFGQRHFMTSDPTGLVVDVITPIRPARSFLEAVARWRKANR